MRYQMNLTIEDIKMKKRKTRHIGYECVRNICLFENGKRTERSGRSVFGQSCTTFYTLEEFDVLMKEVIKLDAKYVTCVTCNGTWETHGKSEEEYSFDYVKVYEEL